MSTYKSYSATVNGKHIIISARNHKEAVEKLRKQDPKLLATKVTVLNTSILL